jgi:hypothetical protein
MNSTQVVFDKQEQYDKIMSNVMHNENVIAVYDAIGAGTGFIGLTNLRAIIQDNSFVGKKVALVSVPYSRVNAVSFISDKSMLGRFASSSSINISAGGKEYQVDFRGEDKAQHAHNVILWGIINATA